LDALTNITYQGSWEVIVIDNASTDGTAELASRWKDKLPGLRIIVESRPGVAHARLRALREARFDALCFVDDDNLLSFDYLDIANDILVTRTDVGVIAGRSELFQLALPPAWFESVSSCYAVGNQGAADGYLPPATAPWGAGTVIRGAAFRQLLKRQFVPLLTGRIGRHQLAGEDVEICYALNLLGWRSYYSSKLVLRHAIEPNRMTEKALQKTCFGFGLSSIAIEVYRSYQQSRIKRKLKCADLPFAVFLVVSLLRAGFGLLLARNMRTRANWWAAMGAANAYYVQGFRPSKVLQSPFLYSIENRDRR
jgi:glycosyltransferase involved in cell wall biosynthesis